MGLFVFTCAAFPNDFSLFPMYLISEGAIFGKEYSKLEEMLALTVCPEAHRYCRTVGVFPDLVLWVLPPLVG